MADNKARRRGFEAERELTRILWRHGFAVVRGPASGARAKRIFYPDLVALFKGRIFIIEVKYRRNTKQAIYIAKDKVDRLVDFTRRAGGTLVVAVKVPNKDWLIIEFDKIRTTSSGGVKIDDRAISEALSLKDFIRKTTNVSLDEFGQERLVSRP